MESEYKISTINQSGSVTVVTARFYIITHSMVEVTEENIIEYPDNQIGDQVEHIDRTPQPPEREIRFTDTDEEQIHAQLKEIAELYGTPIN